MNEGIRKKERMIKSEEELKGRKCEEEGEGRKSEEE